MGQEQHPQVRIPRLRPQQTRADLLQHGRHRPVYPLATACYFVAGESWEPVCQDCFPALRAQVFVAGQSSPRQPPSPTAHGSIMRRAKLSWACRWPVTRYLGAASVRIPCRSRSLSLSARVSPLARSGGSPAIGMRFAPCAAGCRSSIQSQRPIAEFLCGPTAHPPLDVTLEVARERWARTKKEHPERWARYRRVKTR
jgi:hypothetical protein